MNKAPILLNQSWIKKLEADKIASILVENTKWEQPQIRLYGKNHLVPRLTAFIADHDIYYTYSGIKHKGNGWPSWFLPILKKTQDHCKTKFNGCLLGIHPNA